MAPTHLFFHPEKITKDNITESVHQETSLFKYMGSETEEEKEKAKDGVDANDDEQYYVSYFRGRKMTGKKIQLNTNQVALVLTPQLDQRKKSRVQKSTVFSPSDEMTASIRPIAVESVFTSFYLWNRDESKIENDTIIYALKDAYKLSRALHSSDDNDYLEFED